MSAVLDHHDGHDDHAHDHPHGWRRWLYATNHKDIGTMYLWFSFTMLIVGGLNALLLRTELFQPGLQIVNPEFFNQLTTMHGLIMVFGAIMPAFVGFANWQVPLMIGCSDMAFARMNNLSFWLLPVAATLLVVSYLVPGGATAAGWTLYAPLSVQMGPGMDLAIFAVHIMGASSIMGSINIVVTILNMRAPGMTLFKMPLFVWTWLITAYLLIAVMPVLAGAITMVLTDRHFGTSFFNAAVCPERPASATTEPAESLLHLSKVDLAVFADDPGLRSLTDHCLGKILLTGRRGPFAERIGLGRPVLHCPHESEPPQLRVHERLSACIRLDPEPIGRRVGESLIVCVARRPA